MSLWNQSKGIEVVVIFFLIREKGVTWGWETVQERKGMFLTMARLCVNFLKYEEEEGERNVNSKISLV